MSSRIAKRPTAIFVLKIILQCIIYYKYTKFCSIIFVKIKTDNRKLIDYLFNILHNSSVFYKI